MTDVNNRHSDYPIDKLFLERWSPRAFTGEDMSEADLMTLAGGRTLGAVLVQLAALAVHLRPPRDARISTSS